MTVTSEFSLDGVKMKQPTEYLGQRSFLSKVIVQIHRHTHTHTHTHTHWTARSTWAIKMVFKYCAVVRYG